MVCPVLGVVYGFMKWNPALTQITEDMDSCVGLSFHFWKTSAGHNHRQGATATVARAMSLRTARPAGAVTSAVSVSTTAVAETSDLHACMQMRIQERCGQSSWVEFPVKTVPFLKLWYESIEGSPHPELNGYQRTIPVGACGAKGLGTFAQRAGGCSLRGMAQK